jgi:hypothetical protein
VLRYESHVQAPLAHLLAPNNELDLVHLPPLLALLMGSIRTQQNRTTIKSYEKLLTNSMKSFGDSVDSLSCAIPLTDILHHLLIQQLVPKIREKIQFILSIDTTSGSLSVGIGDESSDANGDGNGDVSQGDRHRQRLEKEFISLLSQLCHFIELLSLSHQRGGGGMGVSSLSLPVEYLQTSELINATLLDLTKEITANSTILVPQSEESTSTSPHSSSQEMRRMLHQLTKLLKSHSNQMANLNPKTD